MTKEEMRPFEFEALVCETNAIGAELQGMKAINEYRMQQGMTQAYAEYQFQIVANQYRDMADKFRKLAE